MKNRNTKISILLLTVIMFALIIQSCSNKNEKAKTTIVNICVVDAEKNKDTIVFKQNEYDKISQLSLAAKDVAIYFLSHKDEWKVDPFTFSCGEYEIWIANGYDFINIWRPIEYDLNSYEKKFFWDLYNTYIRKEMRLYKYEKDLVIKTVK